MQVRIPPETRGIVLSAHDANWGHVCFFSLRLHVLNVSVSQLVEETVLNGSLQVRILPGTRRMSISPTRAPS